ncbi:MAG: MFS transporter [Dehalococcoidales bacterium]|nr:MFS transporter [Dehalococcoidales bacterium]
MRKDRPIIEKKERSFFFTSLPYFIVAHCVHHLLTALPSPLLVFIREEFNLSYTKASFVTSAFALANGAGQLPAGFLADRVGPRILITIGILGVAIAGVLVGLSQTYTMLLVCLVLMGLLAGGYHPAATPLISSSIPEEKRGRALGFHLIGGNTSFFLGPIIAGATASQWGWRGTFLWLAVPTALFGIYFFWYLRKYSVKKQKNVKDGIEEAEEEEEAPPAGNRRRLIAFLTMSVLGGGAGMSIMAFITLYAKDVLGASEQTAASLLSIVFFSGLWAGPVGGYVSDKIGRVPIILVTSILSGVLVYFIQFPALGFGFYAILFIIGVNNAFRMPVSEVFIMGQTTAKHRSTIYGVYYFTMQYTGAVFAPIMGWVIDTYGFNVCFTAAAITSVVVTLACGYFLRESKPQKAIV